MINIVMTATRLGEDGSQWRAGNTYSAGDAFARSLIGAGHAYAADGSVQDIGLTAAELTAVQTLINGGINVAPTFLGAYGAVAMDAGSGNVMPTMRVMVNAATDVIAGEQISGAGPDTVVTTISGASTAGEVIVLTATVDITSVHVGFATGSSPTLSSDTTITVNELVRFDFDGNDDVRTVRVYFSPPRSSGRYIDVSCVGQQ